MTEPDVTYQESAMVAMRHMDTGVRALVDYSIRLEKFNDELSDALQTCRAKNDELREWCKELLDMAESLDPEWLHWPEMHGELRKLGVDA